jgi:hypothetical protein
MPDDEIGLRFYVEEALARHVALTSLPLATLDRKTGGVVGFTRFAENEFWGWPAGSPHKRGDDLPDAGEID